MGTSRKENFAWADGGVWVVVVAAAAAATATDTDTDTDSHGYGGLIFSSSPGFVGAPRKFLV